jgi:hypothetical protein
LSQEAVSRKRNKRGFFEEMSKFSLCYALSEHQEAEGKRAKRKPVSGLDITSLKAGILNESIRAGQEVEGEAVACPFAAVYQPRPYYPSYLLGEIRSALRQGERSPATSPHYLPVSVLPPLPDGWRVTFLYPLDKEEFDRPDFPAHVRDVLTRDFTRLPLLIPPEMEEMQGKIAYRANLMQLSRTSLSRLAGLGERSYNAYSARGLTFFLQLLEIQLLREELSLRGSLFAELRLPQDGDWEKVMEVMEGVTCEATEAVFPECTRGERQDSGCYLPHSGYHIVQFRRRLLALVYEPVMAVFRAPRLIGLYFPQDVLGDLEQSSSLFEAFLLTFCGKLEEALGFSSHLKIEIAFDNRLPWARERGTLQGPFFQSMEEEYPFLKPTLDWLRVD